MYKIEKNVPVTTHSKAVRPSQYPFEEMEIGDSFRMPDTKRASVAVLAGRYGKRVGRKFTVRKQEDGSFRCWRIE